MALTKSGRLLVSNYFSGLRYTDDFCTWSASTGIQADPAKGSVGMMNDVKVLRDGTVLALGTSPSGDGVRNRLWRSTDEGATFAIGMELGEPKVALRSLAQSPSHPERLYVTGGVLEATRGAILRSDDGGATFVRMDAPYAGLLQRELAGPSDESGHRLCQGGFVRERAPDRSRRDLGERRRGRLLATGDAH